MATEKCLDFLNNNHWVILVMAQSFHGTPAVTCTVDDVVNELAVLDFNTMPLQQGQSGLAHDVGINPAYTAHCHTGCCRLTHGLVGDEGTLQHLWLFGNQCQQVFHAALGETVKIPVCAFNDQGKSFVMQDVD